MDDKRHFLLWFSCNRFLHVRRHLSEQKRRKLGKQFCIKNFENGGLTMRDPIPWQLGTHEPRVINLFWMCLLRSNLFLFFLSFALSFHNIQPGSLGGTKLSRYILLYIWLQNVTLTMSRTYSLSQLILINTNKFSRLSGPGGWRTAMDATQADTCYRFELRHSERPWLQVLSAVAGCWAINYDRHCACWCALQPRQL